MNAGSKSTSVAPASRRFVWPPERRAPRDLPPLGLHLTGRTVVLVVDANLIIRDLKRMAKTPEGPRPALFELLSAPHGRLVMSASDLAEVSPGISRLEGNIRRKWPQQAEAMLHVWRTEVAPHVMVLDPAGIADTALSAAVRTPERDPDDADLALLGYVLDADGVLTYDQEAFAGLLPTLGQQGEHGRVLSAFRDELRVQETFAFVFGLPVSVVATGLGTAVQALTRRGISPGIQGAVALGLGAALMLWPRGRAVLGRVLTEYGTAVEALTPPPKVHAQIKAQKARVAFAWPETEDPVVQVARYLVRQQGVCSCTALVKRLNLPLTAGALFARLDAHPGLFTLYTGRRWGIRLSEE